MNACTIAARLYDRIHRILRKIRYGCYQKSWVECRENKERLKRAREQFRGGVKNEEPLVSVLVPTYNRGEILMQRAIPSVLKQTYQNFEVIIVGDHCTDNTEKLITNLGDKRLKFYNLPKRGEYPVNPDDRWRVAGVVPVNKAIELSSGEWMAHLDDDDEFSENHIEVLLNYALEHDYELVYGKVEREIEPGKWIELGSYPLKEGRISHLSVLYNSRIKFFKYDIDAWKCLEPTDWNRWKRMKEAGVRIGFIDKVVGKHYLEKTQQGI